jgi:Uncharacterized conserved protein
MYFEKKGAENTAQTVNLALKAAKERGIRHIVVASSSGETALLFANGDGIRVVCVTYAFGFSEDGKGSLSEGMRERLGEKSVTVFAGTHVLSGVERGISSESGGMYPAEIMSNTLRMLGQGVKVCVEVSIMALDAGLIPHGEKVIVVGGSGSGADTAVIITPAHAKKVLKTRIHEILCKPV